MKKHLTILLILSVISSIFCGISFMASAEDIVPEVTLADTNDLKWVVTNNISLESAYKPWYDHTSNFPIAGFDNVSIVQTKRYEPATEPWKTFYKAKTTDYVETFTINHSCELYILTQLEPRNECLKWMINDGYIKAGTVTATNYDITQIMYKKTFLVPEGETLDINIGTVNSNWYNQMISFVIRWLEPKHEMSVSTNSSGEWIVKPYVGIGDKAFTDRDFYYASYENASYPNRHGIDYYGLAGADAVMTAYEDILDPVCGSLSTDKIEWSEITIDHSAEVYIVSPALEDEQGRYLNWLADEGYSLVKAPNGEPAETVINIGWNQTMYLYKKSVEVPENESVTLKLGKAGPESWMKPMYTVLVKWVEKYEGETSCESQISYLYDESTDEVKVDTTINISSDSNTSGYDLSYVVLNEAEEVVFESEGSFDEAGNAVFNATLPYVPGKYILKADSIVLKEAVECEFEIFDYADVIILLDQLKAEIIVTAEDLYAVINDESKDLKIDKTVYDKLSDELKLAVAGDMIMSFGAYTIDEFKRVFADSVYEIAISSKDAQVIEALFAYNDEPVRELMCYDDYVSLEDKSYVYSKLAEKSYESASEVNSRFIQAVGFAALKNISNKTQITGILEKYNELFGYDTNDSEYKKYESAVCSYVAERIDSIDSPDDVTALIKNGIVYAKKLYSSNSSGSSGTGGGGSSSKPSKPVTTEVAPEIANNVPEDVAFEEKISFPDVSENHWAKDSIISLAVKNIISGNDKGLFNPEAQITRAEYIKIIVNAFEIENAECENIFNDVSENDWYYQVVTSAYKAGIIKGNDGAFNPDEAITRQDAFLILYNVLKPSNVETSEISDADEISEYAYEAVNALVSKGFVSGYEDGTVKPKNKITRAEAAKLICNVIDKMKEE